MKLPSLLSLALLAGACSPEEDPPPPPTGDTHTGGDTAGAGDTDRPDTCPTDPFIIEVTGSVTDEAGSALEGAYAQLCVRLSPSDQLQCLQPANADAAGGFTISIPAAAQCMRHATMRMFLPSVDRSTAYCVIDLPTDRSTIDLAEPFVLHTTTPATSLPARDPSDQERTVGFSGGLEIDVVPDRYFASGAGYDGLAARRLDPSAEGLCFVDSPTPPALQSIYAFSPEGDVTGTPFSIRIPNTTGLTAGTVVDLYLLGGLSCTLGDGSHVEEGDWVEIGTATVDSTETTIEGGTIPCITWLGVALQ